MPKLRVSRARTSGGPWDSTVFHCEIVKPAETIYSSSVYAPGGSIIPFPSFHDTQLFPRILPVKMTRPARCVGFVVPGVHSHDAEVELLVDEKPSRNDLTGIACGWPKSRDARKNPC